MSKKISALGIMFELIGIIMILFFNFFMQNEYLRKVTPEGKKIILMIVPENRMGLWIGLGLLIVGFIMIVYNEINSNP